MIEREREDIIRPLLKYRKKNRRKEERKKRRRKERGRERGNNHKGCLASLAIKECRLKFLAIMTMTIIIIIINGGEYVGKEEMFIYE